MSLCVARWAASDGEGGREKKNEDGGQVGGGTGGYTEGLGAIRGYVAQGSQAWEAGRGSERAVGWIKCATGTDADAGRHGRLLVPGPASVAGTGTRVRWQKGAKPGRLVASEWQSVRNTGSEGELPRRARAAAIGHPICMAAERQNLPRTRRVLAKRGTWRPVAEASRSRAGEPGATEACCEG